MRRAPTIRQWLALLLAAFIVPTGIAVVALFLHAYGRERAGVERASQDVAQVLMLAVDRELGSARAALEALATSPSLDAHDLAAFKAQAITVLQSRPGNVLVVSDASLQQIVNTGQPDGAALPRHGDPASVQRVFQGAGALVSDLYMGPAAGRLLTSVDVPVLRAGQVRYVLSMQYVGERLGQIIARQRAPPGATVTIYDGQARIVWSSHARRIDIGQHASSALAAGMALGVEGTVDEVGADGRALVTLFSRSSLSDWTVAIALQRSLLNAILWRSLARILLVGCGLLALGVVLVALIGTRLETAIRGLVRPAVALGRGEPLVLPPLPLAEVREVGHALVQAAALLHERTAQRDQAERAERLLREATRSLEQSEAFLHGVFEETPDGILLIAPDCRVTRANAQAERLFGYPAGSLAGTMLDGLLVDPGAAQGTVCARMHASPPLSGMAGTTALRGMRRDGTAFPADAMANPLPGQGLLIVTVRDVRAGWEQEQALRQALEDKNTLLKELYHRVKNNLQLIISLFNLQARCLENEDGKRALAEAANRVRAMALVHERLVQSRTPGAVGLPDYVGDVCRQLASAASAELREIGMVLDVAPLDVGLDVAVPLGLLLNELVTNSLKHAFPDGRRGTIWVTLAPEPGGAGPAPDAALRLTVRDDGVGLPPLADRTSVPTLGLKLVGALSDGLHGQLVLANRGGACISLLFRAQCVTPDAARMAAILSQGHEPIADEPALNDVSP